MLRLSLAALGIAAQLEGQAFAGVEADGA